MARTRAAEYDTKRNTILRHAASTIAQSQETHCASMSQIAERCQISKALLYHYYDSKDALIFDILLMHLKNLDNALEKAFDGSLPPRDNLRRLVHVVFELYRDSDDEHRVQLTALPHLPQKQREIIRDIERSIVRRFAEAVRQINPELAENGSIITPVTMSLFGMLNWACMWLRPDGPLSREAYADMVTDIFLEGIGALR